VSSGSNDRSSACHANPLNLGFVGRSVPRSPGNTVGPWIAPAQRRGPGVPSLHDPDDVEPSKRAATLTSPTLRATFYLLSVSVETLSRFVAPNANVVGVRVLCSSGQAVSGPRLPRLGAPDRRVAAGNSPLVGALRPRRRDRCDHLARSVHPSFHPNSTPRVGKSVSNNRWPTCGTAVASTNDIPCWGRFHVSAPPLAMPSTGQLPPGSPLSRLPPPPAPSVDGVARPTCTSTAADPGSLSSRPWTIAANRRALCSSVDRRQQTAAVPAAVGTWTPAGWGRWVPSTSLCSFRTTWTPAAAHPSAAPNPSPNYPVRRVFLRPDAQTQFRDRKIRWMTEQRQPTPVCCPLHVRRQGDRLVLVHQLHTRRPDGRLLMATRSVSPLPSDDYGQPVVVGAPLDYTAAGKDAAPHRVLWPARHPMTEAHRSNPCHSKHTFWRSERRRRANRSASRWATGEPTTA